MVNNKTPERIVLGEGKPKLAEFDKSFYSDCHDVPIINIGSQVVALGHGWGDCSKDKEHLRWHLDLNKEYRVILEVKEEGENNDGS